jgi:hypothetical protein
VQFPCRQNLEKQIAIEAKEQERKRIVEAQKQEQDIIDRENMRKDNDALAQRKKQVETKVIEEEAEVHAFAINLKSAHPSLQI